MLFIVFRYNTLRTKTHHTEFRLINREIENIDNLINDAQESITWKSEGNQIHVFS